MTVHDQPVVGKYCGWHVHYIPQNAFFFHPQKSNHLSITCLFLMKAACSGKQKSTRRTQRFTRSDKTSPTFFSNQDFSPWHIWFKLSRWLTLDPGTTRDPFMTKGRDFWAPKQTSWSSALACFQSQTIASPSLQHLPSSQPLSPQTPVYQVAI